MYLVPFPLSTQDVVAVAAATKNYLKALNIIHQCLDDSCCCY